MTPRGRSESFQPLLLLSLTVACLTFAFAGCSEDDNVLLEPLPSPSPSPSPSPNPNPTYPVLSLPANVLSALEMAYAALDSTKYKELYDSTYTGSSTDLYDFSTIFVTFADEARHMSRLASTPNLTATMELGSDVTWQVLPSDDPSHPEWSVIQISSPYEIVITDGQIPMAAAGEPGTFQEFAFRPTLDSSSPTDTLWKIVRWKETGNSAPVPLRRQP
jgi:hypothetical protein